MLNTFHTIRRFSSQAVMSAEFPPASVKAIVSEVAALLKERKETVSVAETVRRVAFTSLKAQYLTPVVCFRPPAASSQRPCWPRLGPAATSRAA